MINEQNFVEIFHTAKIDAENFYFEVKSFFCERKKHKEVLEKLDKLCDKSFMFNVDFISELKKDFEIKIDVKQFGKEVKNVNFQEKLVITTLKNEFERIKKVVGKNVSFENGGEIFIYDEKNRIKEIHGTQINGDYVIEFFEWNEQNNSVKSFMNRDKTNFVVEYFSPDFEKVIKKEVYRENKIVQTYRDLD